MGLDNLCFGAFLSWLICYANVCFALNYSDCSNKNHKNDSKEAFLINQNLEIKIKTNDPICSKPFLIPHKLKEEFQWDA